jgi:hypothetical protein
LGYHTISKKALHKQGPVLTDHGHQAARQRRNRHIWCAGDRTVEPCRPTVGAGLHLLSQA